MSRENSENPEGLRSPSDVEIPFEVSGVLFLNFPQTGCVIKDVYLNGDGNVKLHGWLMLQPKEVSFFLFNPLLICCICAFLKEPFRVCNVVILPRQCREYWNAYSNIRGSNIGLHASDFIVTSIPRNCLNLVI